jgi:hypothetical protein
MHDAKRRKINKGALITFERDMKSPNRELKRHEVRFPTWYPIGRKTMEKSTNSGTSFD